MPFDPREADDLDLDFVPAPDARPHWPQQKVAFVRYRERPHFAYFMEQRTGKSRPIVETCAWLYESPRRRIDGALIWAPNGVHANWAKESFAEFWPKRLPRKTVVWRANKASQKSFRADLEELLCFKGFALLLINYDAARLAPTKRFLGRFLRRRQLLVCADECSDIANDSKRSITVIASAKWGQYRRLLDGAPFAESPFAAWNYAKFLDEPANLIGFESELRFKHHHAEWEVNRVTRGHGAARELLEFEVQKRNDDGERIFLRLPEFEAQVSKWSFRVTREDCGANVPEEVRRTFELHPDQRKAYDELRTSMKLELRELKARVTARHVLTRWLRLQQIASGFVPLDRDAHACPDCGGGDLLVADCLTCDGIGLVVPEDVMVEFPNPRVDALAREVRGSTGQLVVWTRFRRDADAAVATLTEMGRRVRRYDGAATQAQKDEALALFQAGKIDDIVAQPQSAGRGLDMSMARTAIFMSHYHSLRLRLQSRDRIENLNRSDPTTIVDLVAAGTVDEPIVECHVAKKRIQDAILDGKWEELT